VLVIPQLAPVTAALAALPVPVALVIVGALAAHK